MIKLFIGFALICASMFFFAYVAQEVIPSNPEMVWWGVPALISSLIVSCAGFLAGVWYLASGMGDLL